MPFVDFVNEDRYDEMEALSKSLFGEAWDREYVKDMHSYFEKHCVNKVGMCSLDGCECNQHDSDCESCPVNIQYSSPATY